MEIRKLAERNIVLRQRFLQQSRIRIDLPIAHTIGDEDESVALETLQKIFRQLRIKHSLRHIHLEDVFVTFDKTRRDIERTDDWRAHTFAPISNLTQFILLHRRNDDIRHHQLGIGKNTIERLRTCVISLNRHPSPSRLNLFHSHQYALIELYAAHLCLVLGSRACTKIERHNDCHIQRAICPMVNVRKIPQCTDTSIVLCRTE